MVEHTAEFKAAPHRLNVKLSPLPARIAADLHGWPGSSRLIGNGFGFAFELLGAEVAFLRAHGWALRDAEDIEHRGRHRVISTPPEAVRARGLGWLHQRRGR
jgi:hypothetical protein